MNKNKEFNTELHESVLDYDGLDITKFHPQIRAMYEKPTSKEELSERIKSVVRLETDPTVPKVFIALAKPNNDDKFVYLQDEIGREYVIALPIRNRKFQYHPDIVAFAKKVFKKDFKVLGGGNVNAFNTSIVIGGKSSNYGLSEEAKSRVKEILQKQFPELQVL